MPCSLCKSAVKDWNGDDPKCGFLGAAFERDWNCATVGWFRERLFEGVDTWRFHRTRVDDQSYGTVCTIEVEDLDADTLWLGWYKERGSTDAMWLLSPDNPPRIPTEEDCQKIIAHYKRVEQRKEQ